MIEGPAVLTINRAVTRPSEALVAAFAGAMTGHLVDAMDGRGALHHGVKPQDPTMAAICGPALTVFCYPADNLALLAATAQVRPGDIVVCSADGHMAAAVTGDLLVGMLKNAGAAALVTDAPIRDQDGVDGVGLPVFHGGVTPNSPASVGPGQIGLPITCGGGWKAAISSSATVTAWWWSPRPKPKRSARASSGSAPPKQNSKPASKTG